MKTLFFIVAISAAPSSYARVVNDSIVSRADFTSEGLPNVQSASAIAVDWDNSQVLFERNPDEVRPIASLSKLMAALVVTSYCNLDLDGIHIMSKDNRQAARGGDDSILRTGWGYSYRDILHAALMKSDNRALPALAEGCGLTPEEAGVQMTELARRLGLRATSFAEPNGLSLNNVSTAREMIVVLKQVLKVGELRRIMTKLSYRMTAIKGGLRRESEFRNTDRMLYSSRFQILGGKTGYTDLARYCFAVGVRTPAAAEVGIVVMGADGKLTRFADVRRILKWLDRNSPLNEATSSPSVE